MEDADKMYIRQSFIDHCRNGNLVDVRNILLEIYHNPINDKTLLPDCETNSSLGSLRSPIHIKDRFSMYYDRALLWACSNNHLDLVKYLLTNQDFPAPANVNYNDSICLTVACRKGHLEIIHYLLTSPDVLEKPNMYADNYAAFLAACKNGRIEIIEYLTNSEELKDKIDIEKLKTEGFKAVCDIGNITMIDYFVHHPDSAYRVKVNTKNDIGFKLAYKLKDVDVMQFLIFDCGLKRSKYVNRQIHLKKKKNEKFNEEVIKIFDVQNLYEKTQKLVQDRPEKKKLKI